VVFGVCSFVSLANCWILMKRKRSSQGNSQNPRGEPGPDHGAEPLYRGNRKALQLCRQVQRALGYALSGLDDDVLASLYVESVEPAPNEKHLMVTVSPLDQGIEPEEVLVRLYRVLGRLRSEVASDIHRKRVPELSFRCLPPPSRNDQIPMTNDQ
jgi:ribosome-binding factor A